MTTMPLRPGIFRVREESAMTIYLCVPDFEGILCGVYDAWMSRKGHDNVRLELKGTYHELELFSE